MIRVKARQNIVEQSILYRIGDVFEVSEERAKALGEVVEVVEVMKEKSIDAPVEDKMIKSPEKEKRIRRRRGRK